MLAARLIAALDAEEAAQRRDRRVEQWDARNFDAPALLVQEGLKLRVHECEHHHAGLRLDVGENAPQLALRAHQRPQVLDGFHALKLCRRRARYRDAGLAGGIRNQMQMKSSHEPAATLRAAPVRARILNVLMCGIRGQRRPARGSPTYPQLIRSSLSQGRHNGENSRMTGPAKCSFTLSSFSQDRRNNPVSRLFIAFSL